MKAYSEYYLPVVLVGMLLAMYFLMGPRVAVFGLVLSLVWFGIALVLATRPPGVPELLPQKGTDEQGIGRREVFESLAFTERLRIAFGVACCACLLLWLTLAIWSA